MNPEERKHSRSAAVSSSGWLRSGISGAARFWEPRRILYNFILAVVVIAWILASWPHFRPAINLYMVWWLVIFALLANLCYSAAYFLDVSLQRLFRIGIRNRLRWGLWLAGTSLAILLANYWIADEIYPFVR